MTLNTVSVVKSSASLFFRYTVTPSGSTDSVPTITYSPSSNMEGSNAPTLKEKTSSLVGVEPKTAVSSSVVSHRQEESGRIVPPSHSLSAALGYAS